MAQWSRALIDLLKTWALLPELTWQLTTVCNLQFQRIRYSLLPFTGPVHMCMQTYMQRKHPHINKNEDSITNTQE